MTCRVIKSLSMHAVVDSRVVFFPCMCHLGEALGEKISVLTWSRTAPTPPSLASPVWAGRAASICATRATCATLTGPSPFGI